MKGFHYPILSCTQGKVVRNPYTTADGKPIKVKVTTPDGTVKEVDARGHLHLFPLIKVNLCLIVLLYIPNTTKRNGKQSQSLIIILFYF